MEAPNLQFLLKNEHLLKIFHFFRIKYPEVFIKISVLIYSKMSNGANVTVIERKAGSPSSCLYHGVFLTVVKMSSLLSSIGNTKHALID